MTYNVDCELFDVFVSKGYTGSFLTGAMGEGRWAISTKAMMEKFKPDRYPVIAVREECFHDHYFFLRDNIPVIGEHYLSSANDHDEKDTPSVHPFYFFSLDEVKIVGKVDAGISDGQQKALKQDWVVGKRFAARTAPENDLMLVSQIFTRRTGAPELLLGFKDGRGNHLHVPLRDAMEPTFKQKLESGHLNPLKLLATYGEHNNAGLRRKIGFREPQAA
ncbi:MAG TPA: hypothetical protein DCY07_03275 [Rhodospirillaceae bacterium]|nr:hypothetical protein [Rhodospirillaceae bacterium]